mgnify:FL=1
MDFSSIDLLVSLEGRTGLLISAPDTLDELFMEVAEQTGFDPGSFKVLSERKGTWYVIPNQKTYLNTLKKAASSQLEELEFKIEVISPQPEAFSEISWEMLSVPEKDEGESSLSYRILNSNKLEGFKEARVPSFTITLEELALIILQQENYSPGDWNLALYSEQGQPLTGTLAKMPFANVETVLEKGSKLCAFVVPNFDKRSLEPIDHNQGKDTLNLTCGDHRITVRVDLELNTLIELKQKIYGATNIPTFEIKLKTQDNYLNDDDSILQSLGVKQNDNLTYWREDLTYSDQSYKPELQQSVAQTLYGQRVLHSFIYCFSKIASTCENPLKETFLATLRVVTNNCSPLINALHEISLSKTMSLLDSIALEEGFLLLIRKFASEVFRVQIESDKLFENCLEVIATVCKMTASDEAIREEVYSEIDIICPISFGEIQKPVCLRKRDGTLGYYDFDSVMQKANENSEVPEVGRLRPEEIKVSANLKQVIERAKLSKKQFAGRWVGSFVQEGPEIFMKEFPQGVTWNKALDLKKEYKYTKIVSPLSLKSTEYRHCLTLDKNKELRVNLGLTPKYPNKVDLMNVLTRDNLSIDVDDLAGQLEMQSTEESKESITRVPDEAIVVVFDKSSSMNSPFVNEREYTRVNATKQFFENFSDRTVGFDYHHVLSLLLFSSSTTKVCNFTENLSAFASYVHTTAASGSTKLWDCIVEAVEMLKELKKSYPSCILRILCLSDGEDNSSEYSPFETAKKLIDEGVIMDCVVVGELSSSLKGIAFASGGYVFLPRSVSEGLRLFELETLLSVRCRESTTRAVLNSQSDLDHYIAKDFSSSGPKMKVPEQATQQLISTESALKNSVAGPQTGDSRMLKRIMHELANLNKNPHPNIHIYPSGNDPQFWNVFMEGPELTPYQGGLFKLYVRFRNDYPFSAPEIRFLTYIYHCNINSSGRICHSVLDQFYSPDKSIRYILDCIYGLLMTPEPLDPLDANIAAEYQDNYSLYESKVREFTVKHASKTLQEHIGSLSDGSASPSI